MIQNNQTLPPSLLTYKVSTSPGPLTTSTPEANISVVIKANPAVYLDEIIIAIPAGAISSADTVFLTSPLLSNSLSANSGWEIQALKPIKSSKTSVSLQEFKLLPKAQGTDQIAQDLTFTVTGTTNDSVGTARLIISEHSGNQANQYVSREYAHDVVKQGPRPFFLNNLAAFSSKDPNRLQSEFALGEPIHFSWNSNGASYELYQGNITTPAYKGTAPSFMLTAGLKVDTTFILKATFGTHTLYQSLTINITNPALTPSSAVIGGVAAFNETGMGISAPSTFTQNITVKSTAPTTPTTTSVENLTASGTLTAGAATVAGLSTLNGGLTANGPTTIGGPATLNEGLTVNGKLIVNGPISTPLKHQIISRLNASTKPVTLTAQSDGFFTFQMDGGPTAKNYESRLVVSVQYPGDSTPLYFNVYCQAGQGYVSQTIPVCAGTIFSFTFYWFHVPGAVSWIGGTAPTTTAASSLENTELSKETAAFQKQVEDQKIAATRKEAYARSFIEELQVQFDKELSQDAQDLLVTKLLNVERGG